MWNISDICKMLWILSFANNMSKNIGKNISKILSGIYSQKHFDHTKQSTTGALKTYQKEQLKKQ